MNEAAIESLLNEVREVLNGIDRQECGDYSLDDEAWWETTTGAEFGAGRLAALEALLRGRLSA